jgi:hypothetical protein
MSIVGNLLKGLPKAIGESLNPANVVEGLKDLAQGNVGSGIKKAALGRTTAIKEAAYNAADTTDRGKKVDDALAKLRNAVEKISPGSTKKTDSTLTEAIKKITGNTINDLPDIVLPTSLNPENLIKDTPTTGDKRTVGSVLKETMKRLADQQLADEELKKNTAGTSNPFTGSAINTGISPTLYSDDENNIDIKFKGMDKIIFYIKKYWYIALAGVMLAVYYFFFRGKKRK